MKLIERIVIMIIIRLLITVRRIKRTREVVIKLNNSYNTKLEDGQNDRLLRKETLIIRRN